MYRWTTLILGLMLAAALTTILLEVPHSRVEAEKLGTTVEPVTSASAHEAANRSNPPEEVAEEPSSPGTEVVEETSPAIGPLPASAPKRVSFGVVLVRYQGAEGAPTSARSKADAKRLAESLVPEATKDFAAAVQRGDRGSTTNAGLIPQDVLEPALEYALFTLEAGAVHTQPVDTPRGYWVVKRLK